MLVHVPNRAMSKVLRDLFRVAGRHKKYHPIPAYNLIASNPPLSPGIGCRGSATHRAEPHDYHGDMGDQVRTLGVSEQVGERPRTANRENDASHG